MEESLCAFHMLKKKKKALCAQLIMTFHVAEWSKPFIFYFCSSPSGIT